MIGQFKKYLSSIKGNATNYKKIDSLYNQFSNDFKSPKVNLGQIQSALNNQKTKIKDLSEVEFQVFSQWGDDGIIQYLVNKIDIPNKSFIEFGVENYKESNTRFLLINNNWSGYVIDGSPENIRFIEHDAVSWGCELHAEAAFITAENINQLLVKPGFNKEIGILSVDIDGNDYWVWKAIDVVNPVIVISEYNSLFGYNTNWTVPYDPSFVRTEKHASQLYYGVSLKALCVLANEKGYSFIGCNSKGNNAYFIRNDKLNDSVTVKTPEEGYVYSKFREARINGKWVTGKDRLDAIANLEVFDIDSQKLIPIKPSDVLSNNK